jgi:hypothetical protein
LFRPVLVVWQALRRTSERLGYGIGRRHQRALCPPVGPRREWDEDDDDSYEPGDALQHR